MEKSVRILGCSGGLPVPGRWTSSQLITWGNEAMLIDCGEGCQMRLQEYFPKNQKIQYIFISHLHGDHIYGLPGLLSSYTLQRRERDLHIYGPHGLRQWIESTLLFDLSLLSYPLHIHEVQPAQKSIIMESSQFLVEAFPVVHRVPCNAYVFRSHPDRERNIKKEMIATYDLNHEQIRKVKGGIAVKAKDRLLTTDELCYPVIDDSYIYCTDTRYFGKLSDQVRGASALYLECTFQASLQKMAYEKYHCTTADVVKTAVKAGLKKVIVGHYSARYTDLRPLKKELQHEDIDFILAEDGMKIDFSAHEA